MWQQSRVRNFSIPGFLYDKSIVGGRDDDLIWRWKLWWGAGLNSFYFDTHGEHVQNQGEDSRVFDVTKSQIRFNTTMFRTRCLLSTDCTVKETSVFVILDIENIADPLSAPPSNIDDV